MSVNKVILVGNLGKDPELKYTPSGAAVANFSLATTERFKDKDGQMQDKTEWHNIVVWRQLAEICGKYLTKGKQVYIEGKLQTRSYDDNSGNKRYVTEIVADHMRMLGGREEGQRNNARTEPQGRARQQRSEPRQQTTQHRSQQYDEPPFNPDDDIPF